MEAVDFIGKNVEIAKNQPEYKTLPALVVPGPEGEVITCWQLSDDEIEEVIKTRRIYMSQLTFGGKYSPVQMHVGLDGFFEMD